MTSRRALLTLFFYTILVSACGGGSSGNSKINPPPQALFSTAVTSETDPLTLSFDASSSSSSSGSIRSYNWSFGDGGTGTGAIQTHTYSAIGSYVITLTVTNDTGISNTLTRTISVTSNVIATITLDGATTGPTPYTVAFDASASEVLGAVQGQPTITNFEWNFGDGTTASGPQVSHTYTQPGNYLVVLTVTDSSDDTATASVTIRTAFTLSGTISAASGSVVDIDVNDPSRQNRNNPNSVFITNNANTSAQLLPNPAMLNGFISAVGTGAPPLSNFSTDSDNNDFYSAHLLADQFISLRVSDFIASTPSQNDIDLLLYDSNMALIASSTTPTEFESIAITTAGDYFIQVRAISGFSKYALNIGTTSFVNGVNANGISTDFIAGEAIVQIKPVALLPKQMISPSSVMTLSHYNLSRVALTRFTPTKIQTASTTSVPSIKASATYKNNQAKLDTLDYIKTLNTRADIAYAEPNFRVKPHRVPNDDFYFLQSHYPQINLPQAWDITTGTPASGSVVVAVIDSGVVIDHEDLIGQFVNSNDDFDFIRDTASSIDGDGIDADPTDPGDGNGGTPSSWHGTHVAGTIAAASDNGLGVSGVAWGAKIMPIRVLGLDGGSSYDVLQGIRFAAGLSNDSGTLPSKPADIINLSLGGSGFSQSSQNLFNQVRSSGIIVVASAGNENTSTPTYPASYTHVISVSAVDLSNKLAPYSNFGPTIDVTAPGGDLSVDRNSDGYGDGILSTLIDVSGDIQNPSYQFYQGTSMAAPHVAGVAALMKAIHPTMTPAEFESSLQNGLITNDIGDAGQDNQFGYGLIDALKAVQQAQILAGGSATGSILASPTRLDFGSVLSTRTLTLSQVGNMPPNVTNITKNAPWLNISPSTTNPDGSSSYTLTVDRTNLVDATYTSTVTYSLDNGRNLSIPITMRVQNAVDTKGDTGFLYILLLEADTYEFVAQLNIDINNGEYNYAFPNIPFGAYVIVAGSDIDNDSFICGLGESCGWYPTNDQPLRIIVNDDVENLDFLASFVSDAISNAQAGSNNIRFRRKDSKELSLPKKEIAP